MRRAVAISFVIGWALALILLAPDIKHFLLTHPWWHSLLAAVPELAVPVLAGFELRHSAEANTLRAEANDLRTEANRRRAEATELQLQIGKLTAQLGAERNEHLQQIAENTKKPITQAEKRANILRKYIGANIAVSERQGYVATTPQLVEVSNDNIASLFIPYSNTTGRAFLFNVHCDDLEITEIPQGNCPIRLKVLKRYGADVLLGEITKWEDRDQPAAIPVFSKGDCVGYATFVKPGSPETRTLYVYASKDGTNSFLLVTSTGQTPTGNNVEISKQFAVMYVEYLAAGFHRSTAASGSSKQYPVYLSQY